MKRIIDRAKNQHWAGVIALFILTTLVMTYPMILSLGDSIAGPPFDNFEHLYEVWWLKHAIFEQHISPFFNPDLFYPSGYHVLWARNNSVANTILTLPLSLVANEVVAYNTIMLLSFVLSALGVYLLTLHFTGSRIAGVIGGAIFAFCPYRMFRLHVGHLPLLQTQWLPFLFLYVEKTIQNPRPKTALLSGLFYALTILSSLHYGYMALILIGVYVLARARPWREYWKRSSWTCILTFVGTALTIAGPMLYPLVRLYASDEIALSPLQSTWISASIPDFFIPNFFQPLWGKSLLPYYLRNSHENFVSLGTIPLLFVLIALWRNHSRLTFVCGLIAVLSFILALGPTLQVGGETLYLSVPSWLERGFTAVMTFLAKHLALNPTTFYWKLWVKDAVYVPLPTMLLYLYLPFFDFMRYPSRFGVFTALAVAVLAGTGVSQLPVILRRGKSSTKLCLATLILGMILFEFAAVPPPFGISRVRVQAVDRWLATQEGDFAVMKYPLDRALTGPTLFGTTVHGKKVVYGYGSLFPRAFVESMGVLSRFPDSECITLLKRWEVRYILVCSTSYGETWKQLSLDIAANPNLRYVTSIQEEPVSTGDRLLKHMPEYSWWFVTEKVYIYEIVP